MSSAQLCTRCIQWQTIKKIESSAKQKQQQQTLFPSKEQAKRDIVNIVAVALVAKQ